MDFRGRSHNFFQPIALSLYLAYRKSSSLNSNRYLNRCFLSKQTKIFHSHSLEKRKKLHYKIFIVTVPKQTSKQTLNSFVVDEHGPKLRTLPLLLACVEGHMVVAEAQGQSMWFEGNISLVLVIHHPPSVARSRARSRIGKAATHSKDFYFGSSICTEDHPV